MPFLAAGVLVALATSAPAAGLGGDAEPATDPVAPGEVAVVAASAPVRDRVAFMVENGTDQPVRIRRVTAAAAEPDGSQAARTATRDVVPSELGPGERAIGSVRFRRGSIALAPELTWDVRSRPAREAPAAVPLDVVDAQLSAPREGAVAQTLDVELQNPGDRRARAPVRVRVLCLGESGRPVLLAGTRVRRDVRAGATARARVELRELCPSFVVAAEGRAAT